MADLVAGAQIPRVSVTPDKYLTVRYAGASGDFNPIHIDEEFARAVGLPGRILHGLWTMAQVARAQTESSFTRTAQGPRTRLTRARSTWRACPSDSPQRGRTTSRRLRPRSAFDPFA